MTVMTRPTTAFHVLHVLIAALLLGVLSPAPADAADDQAIYTLQVDGLACPFCAYGVEKQLGRIDGVDSVETDIKAGLVVVTMKPGAALDEADAKRAVDAAGFTLRDFKKKEGEEA